MKDARSVLLAAKMVMRRGLAHVVKELPDEATEAHQAFSVAVANKIRELEMAGYRPLPMPSLGAPTVMRDFTLKFLATSDEMIDRARSAHSSRAIGDWTYITSDGEDEKVTGTVIAIEPAHGLLYFIVQLT